MKIFKLVQAGTSFTLMFCLSAGSNSNVTKQDFFSSSDGVRFVSRREKNASPLLGRVSYPQFQLNRRLAYFNFARSF